MKRIISLVTILCTIICATGLLGMSAQTADVSDYTKGEYTAEAGTYPWGEPIIETLMYRLYVPEDYDETKEYPLVVFLHGMGEIDENNEAHLTSAYNVSERLIEDDYLEKYPCIILAPQLNKFGYWLYASSLLKGLIDSLIRTYSIDTERLCLTGLSLGGYGTWDMLEMYPNFFAAAAPLCGSHPLGYYDDLDGVIASMLDTPIWVFHGEKDYPEKSRAMAEAIKAAGGKHIKYTEIPRAGHGIWDQVYVADEFYEWMFAQRLGKPTDVKTLDAFRDVMVTDWYYEAVKYVYNENIFKGVSEDEFKPKAHMTRAMFVTALHRIEGEPASNNRGKFSDVAEGEWYTEAVNWANENGIVLGKSDTEFGPNDLILREQLMTLMYRYAEYLSLDASGRADKNKIPDWFVVSDYAADAVLWAVNEKIVDGKGNGRIAPNESALRGEVATIIKRFMDYKNK